ncbi:LPD38 domain-containing protein [Serratia fonticola]|uniref:LPD38 domain-containing protein n=1 Tax=Serratia fonticola TaxID=47917 RepID=UPI00217A34A6|nr:LPD38 domain-containing protein [Serratia fonticola]CAI1016461.1 Antirestriction protein [Serratia fonticola]
MAYDPQQQRPEEQSQNNNRESLNIRQPGEAASTGFDWEQVRKAREAAGRKTVENNPGIGAGDIARAVASAPFEMVKSGAQIFDAGNEFLDRKAADYRSGEKKPLIDIGVDPAILEVMRDNPGNALSQAGSAAISHAGKLAGAATEAIQSGYSEGAKQAAAMPFVEKDEKGDYKLGAGFFDKDAWMMNAIPTVTQLLVAGGASKIGSVATRNVVEKAMFNRLSQKLPEEAARQVAKETAELAATRAGKTAFVGTMTASAQGSGGTDMRDQINTLPFNELIGSPTFQKAFNSIDANPANANLNDTQKLTLARNQVADQAASAVTADPKLLALNIAASTLGDHTLFRLLTQKGATSGIMSGAALGAAAEGITEFGQGSGLRYAQNQELIDRAGQKIDPMNNVVSTGANQAVVGMGIGGAIGAGGGLRGRRSAPEQQSATQEDQTVTPENSPDGQQPVATTDANAQQDATQQPAPGQFANEEAAGAAATRADNFRDIPAYLRQDPRIQGFAEDNEVQRALAEQQASPTAEELIQQQIEAGDQGFTSEELAAQDRADQAREALVPRLPAPGQTSVIAMPGEVANVNVDDVQAGTGPQFSGGEQVRGQEFIPRADQPNNEVGRANQTYDGEVVPTNAITDKNIIFADGPARNADEVQSGEPPAFTAGETRNQRNIREYADAIGANNQPGALPDGRHSVAGTPVDAQTEAYAKGQLPGDLMFMASGRPFPSEHYANVSRWGKTPGSSVEPVDGGFAVRMPPKEVAPSPQIDNTMGEMIVSASGKPFASERAAGASRWGKTPGAVVESIDGGFGVRMPADKSGKTEVAQPAENLQQPDARNQQDTAPEVTGQINDFGEEIKGAAKHKWGKFSEAMEQQTTDEQYRTEPLSKLFPQPDYGKMSTDGVSHDKLAMIAILRAQIPATKPKRLLQRWVDSTHAMKTLASRVLDGNTPVEVLRQRMNSNGALAGMMDTHDLISSLPPDQMANASKYRVRQSSYSMYEGKRYPNGHTVYELETAKGASVRGVVDTDKAAFMKKARAYIDQESGRPAAPKQTDLGIYADRITRDAFIGYKGASGVTKIKGGFKDPRAARDYLKDNRAALETQIAQDREIARTEQRRESNAPRQGAVRRKSDVTPTQFDQDFGFRGVQFGNYVESGRRQAELNDAYDSLQDMADLIGIPPKAISLNGELGLAFGARGRGGSNAAKAHYEPGEVVINLTKSKGAGSLAHEWFHALDNYFGQSDVGGGRGGTFATSRSRPRMQVKDGKVVAAEHPVRQEVWDAFQGVKRAINESGMVARAQKLDELRSKPYWSTELEMAARAYERYILDRAEAKGISNDYLVNLKKSNEHANPATYAYPTEAELNSGVRDAFDTLFKTLKTKPTEKGIALYSREGADIGDGNIITEGSFDAEGGKPEKGMTKVYAQRVADYWVRRLNGAAKIKVEVVQTQAEAAAMMPNGIPKEFGTVHAIYQPELSRVLVVADNIADGAQLRAKLRHEILAHHGLASVIGDVEYDRIIRVLHQTRDSKNAEIQDVWRQVEKSYSNESAEVQANEFLAHMAERSELTGLGAVWDRVVSAFTNAFRKMGFFNPGDITPAEIRNILRSIAGRFKRTAMYDGEQPGTREFDNTFSRTDALYSRAPTMDEITNRKMGFNVERGKVDKAKDFYGMVRSKDKAELKSWLHEIGKKLNTKTFDGMAPLKYAEDVAGKSDARSSAYVGARMAAGAGSVTAATLEHGLPKYNKSEGVIERQANTGKEDSLIGILDGLGNHRESFLKWIAGHRSERLMAEGKENNFTADEIAYMKDLNKGNEALFDAQKKKYDAFIKSILDLQQDMGLIDPASRANWESAWYLPYYREAENGEVTGPWTSRGIANQSSTVRKLKGSDLTIKDPIENLFNYVAKSIDASMKNEAMRRAVVNLADTGVLEVIDSPNKMDFERIGKDVVKVFTDGNEQLVKVLDPELYKAFTMIDLERSNSAFMKAARQAKRVLTIGTTSMPDFIIRNFIRDSLHSWSINKDGFKAVTDSFRGLDKALKKDDSLIDMMFAGATFGGGYSNVYDPGGTASSIRGVLRRKGYTDSQIKEHESTIVRNGKEAMDKIGVALHKYRGVSEAVENANRVATYNAAIKSGKGKAQAAFESRDLMDFNMMGASKIMINLSDMLPFFNARMQGLSKLGRAIKDDPMGVMKRGGMITAASLALLAMNWDDKRYEELPDWDKDTYWHFFLGDLHVRMPKPFEIGLIYGTMPERFARALGGQDTPGKFGKLMAHNFMATMAFNPIPQVALPIAEAYVNYDFFKGGPIENMADSNLIAGARFNDQTSLLMREVGQATGLSPKMMDHIVQGYTGTLGAYVMGASNILVRGTQDNGETPSMRLDEMPVIKALVRGYGDDPAKSTQFSEDFYRLMQQVNQINSTVNSYQKQGRTEEAQQLKEENKDKLAQRKRMTATQTQLRQLNNQIELARLDRTLTAEQKRERIDRFMAKRNKLTQQAVERVNPYFSK